MTTELKKVRVTIEGYDEPAIVTANVTGRNITTHGSGNANTTSYDVEIAGRTVPGYWHDDARHLIQVTLEASHVLADSLKKIANSQADRRLINEMGTLAPVGWSHSDWANKLDEERRAAKRSSEAVTSDSLCKLILAD